MSRTRLAVLAVAGVLVALFGGRWIASRYTEALWFAELGRSVAFRRMLGERLLWEALTFLAATAWYAIQLVGVYLSIGAVHLPRRIGNLEIAEAVPRRVLRALVALVAVTLGLVTAFTFGDLGGYVGLYRAAVPLGLPEPVLGRDASFYLAQLPLIETLHLMAAIAAVTALLLAGGLYALSGSLVLKRRHWAITPHARFHLATLLAVLALVLAWGFQVDVYQLVGGGGSDAGALTAVDRSLRLPASTILAVVGLLVAALTVLHVRWGGGGSLALLWAIYAFAAVVGRYVAPFVSQEWGGPPSATVALAVGDLEDRYARAGVGVLGVRSEALGARAAPDDPTLAAVPAALAGWSSWAAEPDLIEGWLEGLAADSEVPRAWTVTITAARAGAAPRSLAVAVPETDALGVLRLRRRPSWTQLHRGFLSRGGAPLLVDLSDGDRVQRLDSAPPVRYLAHEADLAVVGQDEWTAAESPTGVELRGLVRRVLLAWALQAPPLLSRQTTAGDRVLYWRDVPVRLRRLYPFATFTRPRALLSGGRLVWASAGYLASDRFPLAAHVDWEGRSVSFLRAPYLATVDATSGATRLYVRASDLFAVGLARAAGEQPLPAESLPPGVADDAGYPAGLLAAQAQVLARHGGDPSQPEWRLARAPASVDPGETALDLADTARGRGPVPVAAALDIDGAARLWQLLPLVDAGGNRLVAFVAGSVGPAGRLEPHLLQLPSSDFPTLAAAESRLSATPALVGAVAAASGPDALVHRSPVVALPAARTVVYAQTLFATPQRGRTPLRVRAVALLVGGRAGVGGTVGEAARELATSEVQPPGGVTSESALTAARAAFAALDSASRRGDWPAFGRALEALRRALEPAPRRQP